jgi:hypothetical protein
LLMNISSLLLENLKRQAPLVSDGNSHLECVARTSKHEVENRSRQRPRTIAAPWAYPRPSGAA